MKQFFIGSELYYVMQEEKPLDHEYLYIRQPHRPTALP